MRAQHALAVLAGLELGDVGLQVRRTLARAADVLAVDRAEVAVALLDEAPDARLDPAAEVEGREAALLRPRREAPLRARDAEQLGGRAVVAVEVPAADRPARRGTPGRASKSAASIGRHVPPQWPVVPPK